MPEAELPTISKEILSKNLAHVHSVLENSRYGDAPAAKLVAVTKTVSPETIRNLTELGEWDLAENRAQVLISKLPYWPCSARLHWIGRLQTNKVKQVLPHITLLHSLDRMPLALEVDKQAQAIGRPVDALVQVNIAGEEQKAGMAPEEVRPFLAEVRHMEGIRICGLMSIMPIDADEEALTAYFRGMRLLFDTLREEAIPGVEMRELSMGMTRDYAIAAREGATMVRVGTGLYI